MLRAITDPDEIRPCQQQLHKSIAKVLKQNGTFGIGYQGGNFEGVVRYNERLWLSSFLIDKGHNKRYWNAFGTALNKTGSNSIVVEINIPFSGINRRVAGLFAKDPATDDIFLLHRGRIGGGKKGIGKDAFSNWFRGEWVEVDEGESSVDSAILITALNTASFFENLLSFVEAVDEFKRSMSVSDNAKEGSEKAPHLKALSYTPEFTGVKRGKRPSSFVAACDHGRIVNALEMYLRKRNRLNANAFFNNREIDLGIKKGEEVAAIYEIKTSTDTQSIYTGIGQLMLRRVVSNCGSTTLVLPRTNANAKQLRTALKKLGIALLEYDAVGNKIRFVSYSR